MTSPQDSETTSVINWSKPAGASGGDAVDDDSLGRHHVTDDVPGGRRTLPDGHGARTGPDDEILPAAIGEAVTCPECGTAAHVTLNRREALDFCRKCDYPLFWAPQKILRGSGEQHDDSLRRLPGQSGRVSVASLPCPFCAEPNALNAVVCVRCGQDMHPVEAPQPVVAPRVYVPPPPAPEPEPERGIPGWVWALVIVGLLGVAAIVVLITTGTIHF